MKYMKLGNTDIEASRICVGGMSFGKASEKFHQWTLNQEDTQAMIKHAYELGVNFIDTANTYGEDNAAMFDGAAANSLYIMLQLMQKAGSVEPADVAAEWEKGGEIETIYGLGIIGGEETYGVVNHAVGSPRAVSIVDKEAEDNWYFAGWVETDIP